MLLPSIDWLNEEEFKDLKAIKTTVWKNSGSPDDHVEQDSHEGLSLS